MRCDEMTDRLDAFVDGDLPAEEAAEVQRHLEGCLACRTQLEQLSELLRRAAALPAEEQPPRDLWPQISARLSTEGSDVVRFPSPVRRYVWTWMAAAAAVVLAIASAFLMRQTSIDAGSPTIADTHRQTAAESAVVRAAYRDVEADLDRVRADLRAVLQSRRSEISPATMEIVNQNLKVIDEAIANIAEALEQEPENPELNRLLLAAYQREVKLLKQVARMPAGAELG
jgi:anti-sigma factor RsiW